MHFILHPGLAGSTLLARALYQPGTVLTLKEPPIHTDVIAYGLSGATKPQVAKLSDDTTRLLARSNAVGASIVIKMNSIGNSLIAAIARQRTSSRILCLQVPLEQFLVSLVSKGTEGRLGGRKLFTGMRNAGLTASILSTDEQPYSDLQLAAGAWLAIQRLMHEAAAEFGSRRVRSIVSEQLFNKPRESLQAVASHFNLELDVQSRLASGVFDRHSKTGLPVDGIERQQQHAAVLAAHGQEIAQTIDWAHRISDLAQITWDVAGNQLLN